MLHSDKFKVEITFGSPVALLKSPMFLDSLLGAVNKGEHHLTMSEHGAPMGSQFFLDYRDVTVLKTGFTRKVEHNRTYQEERNKKGLLVEGKMIGSVGGAYSFSRGQLKNYGGSEVIKSQWVTKAVAWGVGDKEKVRELLKRVHNFGPQARLGFGAVLNITVTDDVSAETRWLYRVLPDDEPVDNNDDYCPTHSPITGPYWDKARAVQAKIYIGTPVFE